MAQTPVNWNPNRYGSVKHVLKFDSATGTWSTDEQPQSYNTTYNFTPLPTSSTTTSPTFTSPGFSDGTPAQQTSKAFGDVKPHYWENESTVSGIDVNRIKFPPKGSVNVYNADDGYKTFEQNRATQGAGYYNSPLYTGGFAGDITQKGPGRTWTDEEQAGYGDITKYGKQPNWIEQGAEYLAKSPGFNAVKGILQDVLPLYNRRAIKEKEYSNQGIAIDSGTGNIVFQQQGWTTDAHGNSTWGAINHLDPRNIMAGYNIYRMNAETIDKRINKILNRKIPQTNASRAKIVALRNFKKGIVEKAEKTVDTIIDRRVNKEIKKKATRQIKDRMTDVGRDATQEEKKQAKKDYERIERAYQEDTGPGPGSYTDEGGSGDHAADASGSTYTDPFDPGGGE